MMRRAASALFGLAVGLGLGLLYAWMISPIQYTDTTPNSLRADYQADYIQLVARSFAIDNDLERARARLTAIGEAGSAQSVTALAQRTAASGGEVETVRSLAALAAALGARPASPTPNANAATTELPGPTATPEPAATTQSTVIPSPTAAPTRTPEPSVGFEFVGKETVCDPRLAQPLIQVLTLGRDGSQTPGVEVVVEWDGGFDHFFTGLKPELGAGYGDFAMTPGLIYNVRLAADPSAVVTGLAVENCADNSGKTYPGAWQLVFREK